VTSSTPTADPGAQGALDAALARLAAEGCVAYPTETVWGLGARALSDAAVGRARDFKGRRDAQPISVLIEAPRCAARYGLAVSARAEALMDAFWPGPLTLVLPSAGERIFAAGIARGDGAVGVRCSSHPIAAALAAAAEEADLGPITATSLNRSGEPPVCSEAEARRLCEALRGATAPLVMAVDGLDAFAAAPSTVLDLAGPAPVVLRWGAIDAAALAAHGVEIAERGA
jgi:L-threonylcarbamoyladenylate synthase